MLSLSSATSTCSARSVPHLLIVSPWRWLQWMETTNRKRWANRRTPTGLNQQALRQANVEK
eukprot:926471-Pelagomonas_calceolata.AAC.2